LIDNTLRKGQLHVKHCRTQPACPLHTQVTLQQYGSPRPASRVGVVLHVKKPHGSMQEESCLSNCKFDSGYCKSCILHIIALELLELPSHLSCAAQANIQDLAT
jgi:hypothetical protein